MIFALIMAGCIYQSMPEIANDKYQHLLNTISEIESGHNSLAIGDNNRSFGQYQIQLGYMEDAINFGKLPFTPDACWAQNTLLSQVFIIQYWRRYGHNQFDPETLARIHNGGPKGAAKKSTIVYWEKIQQACAYD